MNFQKIPPVEGQAFFLDLAFRKAREKVASKKKLPKEILMRTRTKEILKIDVTKDILTSRLSKILAVFPGTSTLPIFYQDLINLTLDFKKLKASFGAMDWAIKQLNKLHMLYFKKIRKEKHAEKLNAITLQYYGRVSSVIKQIDKNFSYLEHTRQVMRTYPDIKELPTICLYGFPNVGKTTLLNALTGTNAKIAAYSFTTISINAGYFTENEKKIQVLDVPGTLAREKHNDIELQAELVLNEVADLIIYVFDLSDTCGYPIEKQVELYKTISEKKDTVIFLSKKDLLNKDIIDSFPQPHLSLEDIKERAAKLPEKIPTFVSEEVEEELDTTIED